ncbi:MAG: hypothetical protein MI740_10360 [Halanaerobiales bacterium]|nr:hypothetical protein [Halanaerobiales bacterium]
MKIKKLMKEANNISREKGFLEYENIIGKMIQGKILSSKEILEVERAFEAQKIMLIVTELSEFIEAHRIDDYENMKEEIADTFIRLADFSAIHVPDIETVIRKKINKNRQRSRKHGKQY